MNSKSPAPRARTIARHAVSVAAMSSLAWIAAGCVQAPTAPSLSNISHSAAPGRQISGDGSPLRIALDEHVERLRFTGLDKPESMQSTEIEKAERMQYKGLDEHVERMQYKGLDEHVERMQYNGLDEHVER